MARGSTKTEEKDSEPVSIEEKPLDEGQTLTPAEAAPEPVSVEDLPTEYEPVEKPFWVTHPDGREFALEGNHAIELFEETYKPEGFEIAPNQPFYCELPPRYRSAA